MTIKLKSEKVPKTMRSTYETIVAMTDEFCETRLNEEYAQLARHSIQTGICPVSWMKIRWPG